jgi:ribosomal protein S18 acetylase RimI-like enzyme
MLRLRFMPENLARITIRPAAPADDEFVHDLASRVFFAYSRDARRAIRSILAERNSEALVAELDALRVGFAVIQYEQLSRDFGPWVKPTAARLNAIAVRPDAHGRGIGRRLLESVIDAARRRPSLSLSLSTGERNTRARRLFTGGGFVQLARVEGYYDGGQTGVLMHRVLID